MVASVPISSDARASYGAAGMTDRSAAGSAPAGKSGQARSQRSAPTENAGLFNNLKKAGKKFADNIGFSGAKFSHANELASIDAATQVELLKEIRNGTAVAPERARLHKIIIDYLNDQLEAKHEIMPGICATGFSHVRVALSPSGVIEDGWQCNAMSDIQNSILDASIAYASNPVGTPPADVFTFHQIITQQSPTKDDSLFPKGPIAGFDGYGNKRMVLPLNDFYHEQACEKTDISHPKRPELGNDAMAWQRAAWLVALSKIPTGAFKKGLEEIAGKQDLAVIERIANMASAIQEGESTGKGIEKYMCPVEHADGKQTFRLRYPEGSDEAQHDCESDLKQLTALLFKDVRSTNGQPLMDADDQGAGIHVITLLNKLGIDFVVLDNTHAAKNSSVSELSFSAAAVGAFMQLAEEIEPKSLEEIINEHHLHVPVVQISEDGIILKLPDSASDEAAEGLGQQNAAHPTGAATGSKAEPSATSGEPAGSVPSDPSGITVPSSDAAAPAPTAIEVEPPNNGAAGVSPAASTPGTSDPDTTKNAAKHELDEQKPAENEPAASNTASQPPESAEAGVTRCSTDAEKGVPTATSPPSR